MIDELPKSALVINLVKKMHFKKDISDALKDRVQDVITRRKTFHTSVNRLCHLCNAVKKVLGIRLTEDMSAIESRLFTSLMEPSTPLPSLSAML